MSVFVNHSVMPKKTVKETWTPLLNCKCCYHIMTSVTSPMMLFESKCLSHGEKQYMKDLIGGIPSHLTWLPCPKNRYAVFEPYYHSETQNGGKVESSISCAVEVWNLGVSFGQAYGHIWQILIMSQTGPNKQRTLLHDFKSASVLGNLREKKTCFNSFTGMILAIISWYYNLHPIG